MSLGVYPLALAVLRLFSVYQMTDSIPIDRLQMMEHAALHNRLGSVAPLAAIFLWPQGRAVPCAQRSDHVHEPAHEPGHRRKARLLDHWLGSHLFWVIGCLCGNRSIEAIGQRAAAQRSADLAHPRVTACPVPVYGRHVIHHGCLVPGGSRSHYRWRWFLDSLPRL